MNDDEEHEHGDEYFEISSGGSTCTGEQTVRCAVNVSQKHSVDGLHISWWRNCVNKRKEWGNNKRACSVLKAFPGVHLGEKEKEGSGE